MLRDERIAVRTQLVNGTLYHVTTRYVATTPEESARRQAEITRAVARSLIRKQADAGAPLQSSASQTPPPSSQEGGAVDADAKGAGSEESQS